MLKSKTTGAVVRTKSANWNPTTGEWMIDGGVLADAEQDYEFVQDAPTVSPVEFLMLLTSAERIAIRKLLTTDPVIEDWWGLVNDQRLTEVDLSLESVQQALDYLTALNLLAAGRKDEILTGKVK